MKIQFKSRKEVTEYLKEKGINTSNWDEVKWQSINKGQAEIHMMALAEAMWDAYNESTTKELKAGEWHIPFGDGIPPSDEIENVSVTSHLKVRIATARCARVSYTVVGEEGKEANYENDLKLHDTLLQDKELEAFQHCAKAATYDLEEVAKYFTGDVNMLCGFINYKKVLINTL